MCYCESFHLTTFCDNGIVRSGGDTTMNYFTDPSDARDFRREAARLRAERLRNAAIKSLGGKCPRCMIETDPRDLRIIRGPEAKLWSDVVFHRRVAEYPDRDKLARLICTKCKFNEFQEARLAAYRGNKGPKEVKGTGEFYWVAGVKLEQKGNKVRYDDGQFSSKER